MEKKYFFKEYGKLTLLNSKRDAILSLLFSYIFNLSFFIGYYINETISLTKTDAIKSFAYAVIPAIICAELFLRLRNMLTNGLKRKTPEVSANDWKPFIFFVCILVIMWIPVFLAYYPGIFSYDVRAQTRQLHDTYSTQHPLAHTLLLNFFYYNVGELFFKNHSTGIACFTVIQMLIFAMAVAYMHLFMYRMKINRKIRIALLIFTGIFPVCSILAVSMTKDIIFTAFFLVFFLCLCYMELAPKLFERKSFKILFVISMTGAILFRNNTIYGTFLMIIAGILFLKHKKRKRFIFLTFSGILISLSSLAALKNITEAVSGSPNEMMSVPYQQLCYVYNNQKEELSQDDTAKILKFIPDADKYNIHISDPVKGYAVALEDENKKEFISLYLKLFFRHPLSYVEAFLHNTMGYWYILDTSAAEVYGYGLEGRMGYIMTSTSSGLDVEHTSYFHALENLYEYLFSLNKYRDIPLLSLLFSIAVYFWLNILCIVYAINLKCRQAIVPGAFLIGYIITVLAGPCVLVRYAFPFIMCLPPMFIISIKSEK